MQKFLIRFLFFFLTIFLTGFISYSQNWANNLSSQQLSKGDLDFYDYQNAFYQDYPKDVVKDGYKLFNNQNEKILLHSSVTTFKFFCFGPMFRHIL